MAIKPTIYKTRIMLSDLNRDHYESVNLTIALHPSETMERMMARILAFCINHHNDLTFGKGISDSDEPDIWIKELNEQINLWIDVGEPSPDRIKKASRNSAVTTVYSFNSKSKTWWEQNKNQFSRFKASFHQFDWPQIQTLATFAKRTMDWSVTITDQTIYISAETQECEVSWLTLQELI
jgi:uncharacterized protein YaeQ